MTNTTHANTTNRYLVFYKSQAKARKAVAGAVYNLASRVVAGVIAGCIVMNIQGNLPPTDTQGIAPAAAAATAVIN